jgi:hypothetical protein
MSGLTQSVTESKTFPTANKKRRICILNLRARGAYLPEKPDQTECADFGEFRLSKKRSLTGQTRNTLLLLLFLLFYLETPIQAADFQFMIEPDSSRLFQHWNKTKKEITGHTSVSYSYDEQTGNIIELSRNSDKKGKIYSEKRLWFSPDQKKLIRYDETDFRTEIRTLNVFQEDKIQTKVWQKDKELEFDIEIQPGLVPFEILPHFLQSRIPSLVKENSFDFTLYLPAIATELKNKGLPLSLSKLEMKASIIQTETMDTFSGPQETITLQIKSTSFLINALLPRDKSTFKFTFQKQSPFHLIVFEEGETRTVLYSIKPVLEGSQEPQ